MAVGGFSSYGQIMANRPEHVFGTFRDGLNAGQDIRDFFKKQNLRENLEDIYMSDPNLDPAIQKEAAAFANVGDFNAAHDVLNRQIRQDNNTFNQNMRSDVAADKRAAQDAAAQEKYDIDLENAEFLESTAKKVREANKNAGSWTSDEPGWIARTTNPTAYDNLKNMQDLAFQMFSPYKKELLGPGVTTDADLRRFVSTSVGSPTMTPKAREINFENMLKKARGKYNDATAVQSQGLSDDDLDRIALGM